MAEEEKEIERVYVIPLRTAKQGKSSRAAPSAMKTVRRFVRRHMKVSDEDIWIDESLNKALWSKGKYKVPSKIRVRAVKFEDGVVETSLPELGFKKSRRELLKEEREKKEPILRKEEVPEGPEEGVAGAEEYEIAPKAEGEVKIKKKKAPKKKKVPAKKAEKPKKKAKKEKKPEKLEAEKPAEKPGKKKAVKKPVKKPLKTKAKTSAKKK